MFKATYFSARDYIKSGWKPVDPFPEDWNTPPLLQSQGRVAKEVQS